MNNVVCVEHVPETAEEEIVIEEDKKGIQTTDLFLTLMNEMTMPLKTLFF